MVHNVQKVLKKGLTKINLSPRGRILEEATEGFVLVCPSYPPYSVLLNTFSAVVSAVVE
jgi:hypothetical protein